MTQQRNWKKVPPAHAQRVHLLIFAPYVGIQLHHENFYWKIHKGINLHGQTDKCMDRGLKFLLHLIRIHTHELV